MATVRKNAITQLKTTLEDLVTNGTLVSVLYNPAALEMEPEYPFAWIVNGADIERDLAGTRFTTKGSDHLVEASMFVRVVGDLEGDRSLAETLEDLIEKVIDEITEDMATFRGLTPAVHITGVLVAEDPDEDMQRDIGVATIEVTYKG